MDESQGARARDDLPTPGSASRWISRAFNPSCPHAHDLSLTQVVAVLSRDVSDWATAALFGHLGELLHDHPNCGDEEMRQ